jgi:hypothetical protein
MDLKLKDGLENATIYIPFENRNSVGKFIDKSLYKYLYRIAPDLFDVVSTKTTQKNDISINNTEPGNSSNA